MINNLDVDKLLDEADIEHQKQQLLEVRIKNQLFVHIKNFLMKMEKLKINPLFM